VSKEIERAISKVVEQEEEPDWGEPSALVQAVRELIEMFTGGPDEGSELYILRARIEMGIDDSFGLDSDIGKAFYDVDDILDRAVSKYKLLLKMLEKREP